MNIRLFLPVVLIALTFSVNAQQQSLDAMIERDLPSLLATYKTLHAAPELSHREEKTAAFVAGELRKLGFTVTERIGKFQNAQWTGYGLVGDIIIGIIGAFVGGWLFGQMGWSTPFGGLIGTIFVAFIGAIVLLLLLRLIRRA